MRVTIAAAAAGLLFAVSAPVQAQNAEASRSHPGPDLSAPQVVVEAMDAADPSSPQIPAIPPAPTPQPLHLALRQDDNPPVFRRIVAYGDWSFDCVSLRPDQLGHCSVKRDLVSQDGRNIVAVLLMQGPASDGEWHPDNGIEVVVQTTVGIAAGVTLAAADGPPLSGPLAFCTETRCIARLAMPEGYLDALMAARGAALIWSSPDGAAVQAGFSTTGLATVLGVPQP
ncbi:MAG: invasion associated locus B family protein [Paracoccus sp. (in: a-proteobacteria)]|nr:invasion associated locus B family protein [Paracoccus sp. (in: a-proteobacteria)]